MVKCKKINYTIKQKRAEYYKDKENLKSLFNGEMQPSTEQEKNVREFFEEKNTEPLGFCSYVSEKFPKTYKECGLIFETDAKPLRVLALDSAVLMILGENIEKIPKHVVKARLKSNFIFTSVDKLLEKWEDYEKVFDKYEEITDKYAEIKSRYFKLHTEVQFSGKIKIKPIAFFGITQKDRKKIKSIVGKTKKDPMKLPIHKEAIDYFKGKNLIIKNK